MKDILEKLGKIKGRIIAERTDGTLRFLGLIARVDLEGKWDILVSADWIRESSSEGDLVYLIEKIKAEFGDNIEFLSKIVLLKPDEAFMQRLARGVMRENGGETGEINDLLISADFSVKQLFVVAIDFSGIDLETAEARSEEPVATGEVANF